MSESAPRLRFGTRGSALALAQTQQVMRLVGDQAPDLVTEPVVIRTEGDLDQTTPLTILGGRGVFTSALQAALLRGEIDAAVHSAKDLPTERPDGLALAAFPEREDPRDVLVSRHDLPLAHLPAQPAIGTSSRRRAVQILRLRPDARIVDLRGNIDTRLQKALGEDFDAIVLAAAGVRRMGWEERITEYLAVESFVPSPGQGALAVEVRANDESAGGLVAMIDDPAVSRAVRLERAFLRAIGGGCTTPIGAHVVPVPDGWRLLAMIAAEDGDDIAFAAEDLDAGDPGAHAAAIAHELLARVGSSPARLTPAPRPVGDRHESAIVAPAAAFSRDPEPPASATSRPLAGLRVLVTRPRGQAAALSEALRAEGAVPIEAPTITIEDVGPSASLERAVAALVVGDYDWVVFTSVNAVESLLRRLRERGQPWPTGRSARVVAVGQVTAAALAAAGIAVDLVPDEADAEGVVTVMARQYLTGQRVLYPKGDQARNVIPAGLRRAGALVDTVELYRTVPVLDLDPEVRGQITRGEVDVVTFASPSSVRSLTSLLGSPGALTGVEIVCVGPVTAAAVRERGLPVHGVAADASVGGIVDAVIASRAARSKTGALAADQSGAGLNGGADAVPSRREQR